ncbi:MAG: dethiobiotin synthase [Methylophilus sp.]|nr:dethiobiotin synthase [Methylophilus sp.]
MARSFFITGTDTGVGKTYIACQLIRYYVAQGFKVVGMKPVAAGSELIDGEWINEDVALLGAASNVKAPRALVNPYCFKAPIAPHIAANDEKVKIDFEVILSAYNQLSQLADVVVVEGAGGLLVPLSEHTTIADLISYLDIPTVLVVGMKLGCLNHALLSKEVAASRKLPLKMWVANTINPPMLAYEENLRTLERLFQGFERLQLNH